MISGSSRGIGKAIAVEMLLKGHRVSLGIRNPDRLKGTSLDPKNYSDKQLIVCKYEALEVKTAEDWVNQTKRAFGGFDSLIHCAGIFRRTRLIYQDIELKDIDELWKINVLAPWNLTRKAWSELEKQNDSRIQVLVSMSGKRSKGTLAGYTASKFALMGLCETIRNEGWEKGIRITAICPGWVNTDMAQDIVAISKQEMTQPEDIAKLSALLLELPNSSIPFELKLNCSLEK